MFTTRTDTKATTSDPVLNKKDMTLPQASSLAARRGLTTFLEPLDRTEEQGKPGNISLFPPINIKTASVPKVTFASPRNTVVEVPATVTNQLARSIWRASNLLKGVAEEVLYTNTSATGHSESTPPVTEELFIVLTAKDYNLGARLAPNPFLTDSAPTPEDLEEYKFTHTHDPVLAPNNKLYPASAVASITIETIKPKVIRLAKDLQLMVWQNELGEKKANILSMLVKLVTPVADLKNPESIKLEERMLWLSLPNVKKPSAFTDLPIKEIVAISKDLMRFCLPGMEFDPVQATYDYVGKARAEAIGTHEKVKAAYDAASIAVKIADESKNPEDIERAKKAKENAVEVLTLAERVVGAAQRAEKYEQEAKAAVDAITPGLKRALQVLGKQISVQGNNIELKPVGQSAATRGRKTTKSSEAERCFMEMLNLPIRMASHPKSNHSGSIATSSPTDPAEVVSLSAVASPGVDPAPVMTSPPGLDPKSVLSPLSTPVDHRGVGEKMRTVTSGMGYIGARDLEKVTGRPGTPHPAAASHVRPTSLAERASSQPAVVRRVRAGMAYAKTVITGRATSAPKTETAFKDILAGGQAGPRTKGGQALLSLLQRKDDTVSPAAGGGKY